MTTTHQKVLRLLKMVDLLRSRRYTPNDLAKAIGVADRTVFRYLADINELLPLQKDSLRAEYYLLHDERLTEMEALVTHSALRMLFHHVPAYNVHYAQAMDKLAKALPESVRKLAQDGTKRLHLYSVQENGDLSRALELVALAWFRRNLLKFDYVSASGSGQKRTKWLEVYFVEVSRSNLGAYAIGFERGFHRKVLSFKLNRMSNITLQGGPEAYSIPDDFSPTEFLEGAWGIVGRSSGTPIEVHLRFGKDVAYRLLEGGYPNMRIGTRDAKGRLEVFVTVGTDKTGFPLEILSWVQSWGPRVEVLAPAALRKRWMQEARSVVELASAEEA